MNPENGCETIGKCGIGGEISRVMLAVKTVLADEEDTPTLIFDEIDTGISALRQRKVGDATDRKEQTGHLYYSPAADRSYCRSPFPDQKKSRRNIGADRCWMLDEAASVEELARLLGGANVTERVMESAKN